MCDNVNNNPFAGLFSTINDAVSFSSQSQMIINENNGINYVAELENINVPGTTKSTNFQDFKDSKTDSQVNYLLADIFGITLHATEVNEHQKHKLVHVNVDSIEQAVFERLMLPDIESKLVPIENSQHIPCDSHTLKKQVISYLFESYCRLQRYKNKLELSDILDEMRRVIVQNAAVALQEPDLFEGQEVHNQFIALCADEDGLKPELVSFSNDIVNELQLENSDNAAATIAVSFSPILDIIYKDVTQSNLVFLNRHWFTILNLFALNESLAELLIRHSTPKSNQGQAYANTLLGAILSLSCLPKTIEEPFYFFEKPFQQSNSNIEGNIWTALDALNESLQKIFHLLLKCSAKVRHLTLQWIGNCLHSNASRGKIWNSQNNVGFSAMLCVSDGFMLNLGNVLLRLCQPFCIKLKESKVPKIDPTYCAAETSVENECLNRAVHLKGMSSETCLIPISEHDARPVAKTFGFTTECFFLTHRALDLGYRVVSEKFLRTSQDLSRVYQDAQSGGNSEVLEMVAQRMEAEMTKYLSLRASLLAPEMLELLAKFHATTAFWLVQVYLNDVQVSEGEQTDYVPKEYKPVTFPLPETVPDTLRCIPEFVVENTIRFLCFLRRFNSNVFEEQGSFFLTPVLTEIIVLMESQQRLYNPHLRARLAEGLEALLPTTDDILSRRKSSLGTFHREQLFMTHPCRQHIVASLLKVFVSIEMTGQSVQFEQKFNYRRPMYVVMEYLWKLPERRNNFITLAEEAEANMEAAQPPLFLRFINLLMNDAVFLLDEALSNMAQLRQLLQARESGEWNKLPQHERDQQAYYLLHLGMIARFDNILGRKTIRTLKMLTTDIKSIFCHPTMVDRIASMLNYLLLQLVGPNKKNLKVNDQNEYAFNPANLVLNICEIYINLSQIESFTLAVSQDGRSYSPELFRLADNVLVRIGGVGILGDLDEFAKNVEAAATHKREEDEILVDAPEEFLDPIMSTLMMDPVILPSSKITIDRQTIARHLLSDQTDPFNRSPLTMDMVKSDVELQHRIQEWVQQKKQERTKSCQ